MPPRGLDSRSGTADSHVSFELKQEQDQQREAETGTEPATGGWNCQIGGRWTKDFHSSSRLEQNTSRNGTSQRGWNRTQTGLTGRSSRSGHKQGQQTGLELELELTGQGRLVLELKHEQDQQMGAILRNRTGTRTGT